MDLNKSEINKIPSNSSDGKGRIKKRRSSKRTKRKRSVLKKGILFIRKNPYKVIALFCACILIYVTLLFILYDKQHKRINPDQQIKISK